MGSSWNNGELRRIFVDVRSASMSQVRGWKTDRGPPQDRWAVLSGNYCGAPNDDAQERRRLHSADLFLNVIPAHRMIDRHCERSEAIQNSRRGLWIASSASPPRNDEQRLCRLVLRAPRRVWHTPCLRRI